MAIFKFLWTDMCDMRVKPVYRRLLQCSLTTDLSDRTPSALVLSGPRSRRVLLVRKTSVFRYFNRIAQPITLENAQNTSLLQSVDFPFEYYM